MISRILVTVDSSEHSDRALDNTAIEKNSRKFDAKLLLLLVNMLEDFGDAAKKVFGRSL
jgi:hypothetical protein